MFKSILVPIDLADTDLAKPAITTAATLSQTWNGTVRLLNVLPMTPVMLAEYVPADFDTQQRETSEEALAIVARESGIEPSRISGVVRQGGIYHEILEEAAAIEADNEQRPGEFASRDRANQKPGHRCSQHGQQDKRRGIGARAEPAAQGGAASTFGHALMQLHDEAAIILVLRRHQGRGLPRRRQDGDPRTVCTVDVGAKAARLHGHRAIRPP